MNVSERTRVATALVIGTVLALASAAPGIQGQQTGTIQGTVRSADDGATIEQILETFTTMPFDIQVGDTARMVPGCDKVFQTCIDKYNNPRRFKGEPFVAGADILGQYPDAPQG